MVQGFFQGLKPEITRLLQDNRSIINYDLKGRKKPGFLQHKHISVTR